MAALRAMLWPDSIETHQQELRDYFQQRSPYITEVLVAEENGQLKGFIELNVRSYAEGSEANQVPYIEGWYVAEDCRGQGYGKLLVNAAETWAIANGFSELASDSQLHNHRSIHAHQALGFVEVDRVVCFIKKLVRS